MDNADDFEETEFIGRLCDDPEDEEFFDSQMEAHKEIEDLVDAIRERIFNCSNIQTPQNCSDELTRIREMCHRHQPITNLVNLVHPAYDRVARKLAVLALHFRSNSNAEDWPIGDALWRDRYGYDIEVGFRLRTSNRPEIHSNICCDRRILQFVVGLREMFELIQPESAHLKEGWNQFSYYWVSLGNVSFRKKLGLADDCLKQTDPAAVGETREILLNELQRRERETYGSASTLKWVHEFCSKRFLPQFAAVVTRMQSGDVEPRDSSISTPYDQMMAACGTLFPSQPVADDGSIKTSPGMRPSTCGWR